MKITLLTFVFVCFIFFIHQPQLISSSKENAVVDRWAKKLGEELWDLAQTITQREEIKSKYKESNAVVEKKNPISLLTEIVEDVTTMMKRKMDAVRCILMSAEEAAEEYVFNSTDSNFTYYNSKYSTVIREEVESENEKYHIPDLPETIEENGWMYENFTLTPNSHFYNIPVNTSYSSVHVPTNVYDKSKEALASIEWSESLDDVFIQNYNSDPALSWQFFGSSSGVMRHYPAMQWMQEIDLFDCRTRSWFIEAATCTKDVIILLDNSGSMTGMRNHTARFTVSKILDTFSNNDFINVFQYHTIVEPLEKCFDNTLVQATKENIAVFKNRMNDLLPENHANLTLALRKAFDILEKFREIRGCGDESMHCNQAIMIVTDGVPNNATEVFEEHNWLNNGTNIPVRIFPYLIGREVANLPEIKWMACLNRGYFAHIRSLDETSEQVLKYIPVIAQPLVLQAVEHPVSWTHAYITDRTFEDKTDGFEEPIRLLTSVAVPAYDRKSNLDNRTAELLGVAGTDVPIEDIEKLVNSHKIGVNGYAFVISNNGYIIMHPDLRPLYDGKLNPNYNSMDLTELEFMDDDTEPRVLTEKIKELREAMVNGTESFIIGIPIKKFYDDMKRPFKDIFDYFFAPIEGTPFSLGIALPQSYGSTLLKINDVIGNNQHMGRETASFFKIGNWKVHPKWDYCKYRYLEGHEFKTPEEEVAHFLEKVSDKNWKWTEQYEEILDDINVDDDIEACTRKTYENDDYFCNQDLFQRLVFDAMITYEAFSQPWKFRNDREEEIFKQYNASLRFVATMSGLTRWKYIDETNNNTERNFGDVHCHSIDENWYKSAVLQYTNDPESFVYSVPFESGGTMSEDILVTGSHAIFHSDGGLIVPGSVVGFQFQHSQLYKRFMEITSKTNCQGCIQPCSDDMLDCYIIDNNGYIVISENHNDTGRFFGEIDGAIMESMLENKTFDRITLYDLQAVCTRLEGANSDGNILLTPFNYVGYFLNWVFYDTLWALIEVNLLSIWNEDWMVAAFENYDDDDSPIPISTTERISGTPKPTKKLRKGQNREEEEYFQKLEEMEPEKVYISEPCDKKATLYMLNQTRLDDGPSGIVLTNFTRPYFIKRIPHSNLILVIVNTSFPTYDLKLTTSKQDIIYSENFQPPCNKLELNNLTRRKLSGCFNEHPMEYKLYELCDSSIVIKNNLLLLLLLFLLIEFIL